MAAHTLAERDATAMPGYLALASTNHGMPSVSIPANFKTDRRGFVNFTIPTDAGQVSAYAYWKSIEVKGSAVQLLLLRLLRPEWLPGVPGNGKTMQTVVFEPTGPRLLCSKGSRQQLPHIVIKRISRISYSVKIPATDSQIALIQRASDEFDEQKKRDEQEKAKLEWRQKNEADRLKCAPKGADEFRDNMLKDSYSAERLMDVGLNLHADFYRLDDAARDRMRKCWDEIRTIIDDGRVIPMERSRHKEGNVILLGRH
jgi:hypothetical protein